MLWKSNQLESYALLHVEDHIFTCNVIVVLLLGSSEGKLHICVASTVTNVAGSLYQFISSKLPVHSNTIKQFSKIPKALHQLSIRAWEHINPFPQGEKALKGSGIIASRSYLDFKSFSLGIRF